MGSYSAVGVCDHSFDVEAVGVPADAHRDFRPPQSWEKDLPAHERCRWWSTMKTDVFTWYDECLTCIRFRKRPTRQDQVAVKPTSLHPWQEVMIDCEGSSRPPDAAGNTYVLSYFCCLTHAVLLEPMRSLTHSEVRRAFSRALFRSGTIPKLLRSDRGPELKTR